MSDASHDVFVSSVIRSRIHSRATASSLASALATASSSAARILAQEAKQKRERVTRRSVNSFFSMTPFTLEGAEVSVANLLNLGVFFHCVLRTFT